MDILSLAVSKKYTEDTAIGMGAVKGKDGEPGPQGPQGPQGEKGPKGQDGSSITITKITESSENGGENVVVFSDGKKLSVKNGKGGGGGLTEVFWKDIKDRPFDATTGLISIIESQSVTTMNFEDGMGVPAQGFSFEAQGMPMTVTKWYNEVQVSFDGIVYNVAKKYFKTTDIYYFGNGSIFNFMGADFEDTGEPFVMALISDNYVAGYIFLTTDIQETEHTISMSAQSEIIKTIDPKYIADMYYDTRTISYYSQEENPNPPQIDNAMMNMSGYKVSDLVPTRTEILNNTKVIVNGTESTFIESNIQLETGDFVYTISSNSVGFIFVNKSGTLNFTASGQSMSIEVPEGGEGIYYVRALNAGVPEGRIIEFIIGELKQIDPKFIPADLDFNLDDYYTKSEVDAALDNIDLNGYYTKNETYSKSELDEIIGDIDFVINEINNLIGE